LLCLVVVDGPQTDGRWGNTIAGPVFNAIMMEAARYLGIPPAEPTEGTDQKGHHMKPQVAPSVKYGIDRAAAIKPQSLP
jgi:hypothetical protein